MSPMVKSLRHLAFFSFGSLIGITLDEEWTEGTWGLSAGNGFCPRIPKDPNKPFRCTSTDDAWSASCHLATLSNSDGQRCHVVWPSPAAAGSIFQKRQRWEFFWDRCTSLVRKQIIQSNRTRLLSHREPWGSWTPFIQRRGKSKEHTYLQMQLYTPSRWYNPQTAVAR